MQAKTEPERIKGAALAWSDELGFLDLPDKVTAHQREKLGVFVAAFHEQKGCSASDLEFIIADDDGSLHVHPKGVDMWCVIPQQPLLA
jgi:hypothetical protein